LNQGRIFNEHGPSINFNSYSYQNEPKNKEESNHLIEIVNCLFTALLAIFTGILAKATIRLFKMAEVGIPADPAGRSNFIRLDLVGAKRRNDKIN
jgi:hypothetical protein